MSCPSIRQWLLRYAPTPGPLAVGGSSRVGGAVSRHARRDNECRTPAQSDPRLSGTSTAASHNRVSPALPVTVSSNGHVALHPEAACGQLCPPPSAPSRLFRKSSLPTGSPFGCRPSNGVPLHSG